MSETPSAAADRTSMTLLGLARDNDPEAWRRLVGLYGPAVFGWAKRSGLTDDDAADVCQNVWAAVDANLGRFRKDKAGDTFRGWLWTITRNKIRDWARAKAESVAAAGGTDAQLGLQQIPDIEPPDESGEHDHGMLRRALDLIRPDFEESTWQAFWRLVVLGHAARDVAADLGLAPNAVHQARFRVVKRLRAELTVLDVADDPSFVAVLPAA
jgi:RNA polymerase sigma-70 factor (ECF subfamily)